LGCMDVGTNQFLVLTFAVAKLTRKPY